MTNQPEPQPRREGLARRPGVHDPVRGQPLQGADRRPVVAVLGVVVVLDDHRAAPGGPAQHRGPPLGGQHRTGRPLVRRRQHDGVGAGSGEQVDPDAVPVHRDPDDLEPGRPRGGQGVVTRGGVLQREPPRARRRQHADEQRDALRVPGADHDLVRLGHGAADPVQVAGDRRPQLRHAAARQVAEQVVRRAGQRAADRAQPRGAGEAGHVGAAVAQVDPRRGLAGQPEPGHGRGRAGRHLGIAARVAGQVALGRELLVGLDHHAAGDAQVGGQHPGGRQGRAARQPPGADRVPDRGLDLPVQRDPGVALERRQARWNWSWFYPSNWILSSGPIPVRLVL